MPEAAEAGDDLVGDIEHVVLPAHLERAALVALGRDDDAARGQQRLGDEAGDPLRSERQDLVFEVLHLGGAEFLLRHAVGAAIGIGRRQVVHRLGHEIEQAAVAGLAGDGGREIGAAVIGGLARDDVLLPRPADVVEIELDEAQRGIDGGRAAGREEDVAQVARRVGRKAG
jgi:hypothetical protein